MRLGLVLSEASHGLRRNASMVVSVVLVTFISLTFVGAAILMQMQIGQMKNFWYDRAQVGIYMCTAISPGETCTAGEASQEQIDSVEAQLESPTLATFIDKYYFETHDQAYENFQDQFAGNPVAEYVTPEQLNQTFWVNLTNPRDSDVLVVACRADGTNRGLVSAEVIEALGPGGLLVNVARGSLVDEDALIAALKAGRLGQAALDVFETEPTDAARWADVPNTVLTPHTAGATGEAVQGMLMLLMQNLAAVLAGEPPRTPVTSRTAATRTAAPPAGR